MIIDCHGHFTTVPRTLHAWREKQLANINDPANTPKPSDLRISDDEIRTAIETGQLKLQKERGSLLSPSFSPIAGQMGHHLGNQQTSYVWSSATAMNLVYRVISLSSFPENFVPVCQLPQSTGESPANCIPSCAVVWRNWASWAVI